MINWTFYINSIEIEEPIGFEDMVLSVNRDDEWHGIFFESSIKSLQFYGTAADLLIAEKESNGLAATATFTVRAECGETYDLIEGTFDFGTYTKTCGSFCVVEIHIEKTGCLMKLKNRYTQPVDMQKTTAFDNTTLLQVYDGLDIGIELLAQKLLLENKSTMEDAAITTVISDDFNWVPDAFGDYVGYLSPALPKEVSSSLGTFHNSSIMELGATNDGAPNQPPYPNSPITTGTASVGNSILCELKDTSLSFRLKGSVYLDISSGANRYLSIVIKTFRLPTGLDGTVSSNWVMEYSNALLPIMYNTGTYDYDVSDTIVMDIEQGDFIYFGLFVTTPSFYEINSWSLTQDIECYYDLVTSAVCEPSNANSSLVNEFASRMVESITDGCFKVKSDYYGRIDSQPYASTSDGCGSLRVLTSGLKIRNAITSNHFLSFSDLFDGLKYIDNIGLALEDNPNIPNSQLIRIEPVEYFYQDFKIISLPFIPESVSTLDSSMAASIVDIGYKKWEVDRVNGLDEFNSNKKFRTSLSTITNEKDFTSKLVAGGYPIEVTRQQSFAETGAADTSYDNETFVICITREGVYHVKFYSATNSMIFITSGDGSEFLIPTITIANSVDNNGTRTILSTSITALSNNRSLMNITFNGGATIDETSDFVTFTGIVSNGYFVEKGIVNNATNIFSPDTCYNWRIRPMYNLMRWFKSIANVYINLNNSISKLFFASGTGNYVASGNLPTYDLCSLESGIIAENTDLSINNFNSIDDYMPIVSCETIKFTYPLSIADYLYIKDNPLGCIEYQCGTGVYEKGFIKNIEFSPAKGEARFTLIKKWQ